MLDECESIFEQFSSTTATKSNKSYDVLLSLVNRYKKLLYADAFISNRTISFIETFNKYDSNNKKTNNSKVITKKITNNRKSYIYKDKIRFQKKLLMTLMMVKYIYCFYI
jgi:hypothetical protein